MHECANEWLNGLVLAPSYPSFQLLLFSQFTSLSFLPFMSNSQGLRLLYCPSLLICHPLFCKFPNPFYRKQLEPWKRAPGSLRRDPQVGSKPNPRCEDFSQEEGVLEQTQVNERVCKPLIYMRWASQLLPGSPPPSLALSLQEFLGTHLDRHSPAPWKPKTGFLTSQLESLMVIYFSSLCIHLFSRE